MFLSSPLKWTARYHKKNPRKRLFPGTAAQQKRREDSELKWMFGLVYACLWTPTDADLYLVYRE
jgi:hypothetical protein